VRIRWRMKGSLAIIEKLERNDDIRC
jgi:hypothetical protein